MTDPGAFALGLVAIPLLTAILSFLSHGSARTVAMAGFSLAIWPLAEVVNAVWCDGAVSHHLGGWRPPLGISVGVDGSTAFLLAMVWIVGAGVTVYGYDYFGKGTRSFWPLWMFLLAGLNALLISEDLFNLYVTLELVGLSAIAMTAMTGEAPALKAAVRYLIISLTGSLLYLLGVAITYAAYGSVDIGTLRETVDPTLAGDLAVGLMTAGLIAKAALFPCHVWLPPAHANAPAPVSALLSALVVKAALIILVRVWTQAYAGAMQHEALSLLGYLGAGAVGWGAVQAIFQKRLKMLIAYSTVAQLGYLFLALPLLTNIPEAWAGILILLAAHALAKTALFLAAGNIIRAAGHDTIAGLGAVLPRLPVTAFAFALAGISIIGLPPSGGFLGKWLLIAAALNSNSLWMVAIFVSGGLLASIYIVRVVSLAFSGDRPEEGREFTGPSRLMEWTAFAMALAAIALGLASEIPLQLINGGDSK